MTCGIMCSGWIQNESIPTRNQSLRCVCTGILCGKEHTIERYV
jgi:hypothetical protein